MEFLKQAHAGYRPARAWFLEITFVQTSVYVCVTTTRLLITTHMK